MKTWVIEKPTDIPIRRMNEQELEEHIIDRNWDEVKKEDWDWLECYPVCDYQNTILKVIDESVNPMDQNLWFDEKTDCYRQQ